MSDINTQIPNWKRFREKYPDESGVADEFEIRYGNIPKGEEKKRLANLMNVELGVVLLRETEIDREAFSKMLSAIAK